MSAIPPEPGVVRLGVAGWPVAHSRSPVMQNAALDAVGLAGHWRYQLLPIPPELFEETVRGLPGSGFRGINVTIPHKAAALQLADMRSDRARAAGAANTLIFEPDGTIFADNTDAPALTTAVRTELGEDLLELDALVLGAGGSARAAVVGLADLGVSRISVWNRTSDRARELCETLPASPVEIPQPAALVVNCTSVGLAGEDRLSELHLDELLLGSCRLAVDFVYAPHPTPLQLAAQVTGRPFIGGLELLVLQGAASFTSFTGLPAPVSVMRDAAAQG